MNRRNWDLFVVRIVLIAIVTGIAFFFRPFDLPRVAAAILGFCAAVAANLVAFEMRRAGLQSLIGGSLGAVLGAVLALLFVPVVDSTHASTGTAGFFRIAVPLLGGFIGLLAGIGKADRINLDAIGFFSNLSALSTMKILDTSVIIDGRISDIAESGFLDGKLVIPQFVLHELQLVADSSDSAKRNRGRRGLDVVKRLQNIPGIHLEISAQDFPAIREVDLKLIELAKSQAAKIVTNDFNLNKLAQVQGVQILNINELANALKPVVLPGETMRVFILKEGKEYNQGVAYLDDGTMVVVDNARRFISRTLDITVTSVLQTTAGKMIFGKYDERLQGSGEHRAAATSGT